MKRIAIPALCLLLSALGPQAVAHKNATGVVKQRMDMMVVLDKAMKVLGPVAKGEADIGLATEQARIIGEHGGAAMTDLFPHGSLMPPSEALDAVWEEPDGFRAYADQLTMLANHLERAAAAAQANDQVELDRFPGEPVAAEDAAQLGVPTLVGLISETCSGCHLDYRKD